MPTGLFKLIFVIAAGAASTYSISEFGPGMWSYIFVGVAALVFISTFVKALDALAIVLGALSGGLSAAALGLLLLAATVGGSFSMSESNVIFTYLLVFLALSGLSAFFWKDRLKKDSTEIEFDLDDLDDFAP